MPCTFLPLSGPARRRPSRPLSFRVPSLRRGVSLAAPLRAWGAEKCNMALLMRFPCSDTSLDCLRPLAGALGFAGAWHSLERSPSPDEFGWLPGRALSREVARSGAARAARPAPAGPASAHLHTKSSAQRDTRGCPMPRLQSAAVARTCARTSLVWSSAVVAKPPCGIAARFPGPSPLQSQAAGHGHAQSEATQWR